VLWGSGFVVLAWAVRNLPVLRALLLSAKASGCLQASFPLPRACGRLLRCSLWPGPGLILDACSRAIGSSAIPLACSTPASISVPAITWGEFRRAGDRRQGGPVPFSRWIWDSRTACLGGRVGIP
jgi:hypothetical protein